jgi:nickel-type superoxide dismutase maturation protease
MILLKFLQQQNKAKSFVVRRVVGDSMLPTLRSGRIVIATSLCHVREGTIVIAFLAGREVVKRVHRITASGIDLRGDNDSASSDSRQYGRVQLSDIIGRVLFVK